MVKTSTSQAVDLGFISLVESYQKTLKMVSTAYLLGAQHLKDVAENEPTSSLVVSLAKALYGTPPPLRGRQVAQAPRKWQLPKRVRTPRPIDSDTIRFLLNGG